MLQRFLISVSRPHYLFRPQQLIRRLVRQLLPPAHPHQAVTLPWGIDLNVNINEHIGRSIWLHGLYACAVSEALWRLVDDGDLVVDAGANIGHMTGLMALRAGHSGSVLAFEPHPTLYSQLEENIAHVARSSDTAPIEAHEVALSDRDGTAGLAWGRRFDDNQGTAHLTSSPSSSRVRVACRPLDDVVAEHLVSMLKLDVEGHEMQVLIGARRALREGRITHIVYEDLHPYSSSLPSFLEARGFTVFGLGEQLHGPCLMALTTTLQDQTAPHNYLATRRPQLVERRFAARGWSILQS